MLKCFINVVYINNIFIAFNKLSYDIENEKRQD